MNPSTHETESTSTAHTARLRCGGCGANLVFDPSVAALQCPYCGSTNEIPQSEADIEELDFEQYMAKCAAEAPMIDRTTVKCTACAAEVDKPEHVVAMVCPFCGSSVSEQGVMRACIAPGSLLPFHITRDQARSAFQRWVAGLWFAPSKLKAYAANHDRLQGVYVPYWTYDCDTISLYTGMRGDDYWETQHYTTVENGKTVHKTRQVRKTRWWPVSGRVFNAFDDILILAATSLPRQKTDALAPWDLGALTPFRAEYLSGFVAQRYQVSLADGFKHACGIMDSAIDSSIRSDIGGDHQQISSVKTDRRNIHFKHLLLPIWISSYRFNEKVYRYLVNGRTGEVQGERPWSAWKIFFTVVTIAAIAGAAVLIAHLSR